MFIPTALSSGFTITKLQGTKIILLVSTFTWDMEWCDIFRLNTSRINSNHPIHIKVEPSINISNNSYCRTYIRLDFQYSTIWASQYGVSSGCMIYFRLRQKLVLFIQIDLNRFSS